MKKLASLFCLLAFCAVSADGQSFQQPLEKVFHYMMPGHAVRHHAVQKSYTDSLLSAYTVMSRNNGLTTSMYYELQEGETFLLDEITYTYVKDGKVMETGTLSATGDTLDKTVYQYYNNSNEIHSTYEYFGGTDPELVTMGNLSTYTLQFSEPEKVQKSAEILINTGIDILAPACGLSTSSAIENLQAFTGTVKAQ